MRWDGHTRWEFPHEVGMVMRGEVREVRYARYEPPSKIFHSLIFLSFHWTSGATIIKMLTIINNNFVDFSF